MNWKKAHTAFTDYPNRCEIKNRPSLFHSPLDGHFGVPQRCVPWISYPLLSEHQQKLVFPKHCTSAYSPSGLHSGTNFPIDGTPLKPKAFLLSSRQGVNILDAWWREMALIYVNTKHCRTVFQLMNPDQGPNRYCIKHVTSGFQT